MGRLNAAAVGGLALNDPNRSSSILSLVEFTDSRTQRELLSGWNKTKKRESFSTCSNHSIQLD